MTFVLWEILIPLIIAFLLGLLFGWLFWGWRRTKITYTEWETMRQKANRSSSVEVEAELAELSAERDGLQAKVDSHVCETAPAADLGAGVLGVSGAAAVAAASDDATDTGDVTADAEVADDAAVDAATDEAADASDAPATGETDTGETDTVEADTGETADAAGADSGERAVTGERYPYGEGSHAPFAENPRDQPDGFDIKGNADSMLYHRTDSRSYKATIPEVWFDTAERAEAAGFGLANSHPKDKD